MNEMGRKLLIIRKQRRLSLRQVERLTSIIAKRCNDKARKVSASWLGRIERENHSIAHKRLESLEEVYGVSHRELVDESVSEDDASRSLHAHFPDVPAAVLKGLSSFGGPLMPPEGWLAYFPNTTLLPVVSQVPGGDRRIFPRRPRDREPLYGILGINDTTLVPFVQPGGVVEINPSLRTINPGKIFHSVYERPIYFLRSHDGYHCGWCELDAEEQWLTLVPSAMTATPHLRWRSRLDVEVIGTVTRILTRLGFPEGIGVEGCSHPQGPS